ncbi:hypothetical protein EB73_02620 [Mycobacterium sp. SWH-M3]|nr:hypothetical protein EB73_02620 [Mycobacterium sp. SWH-M3]
MLRSSTPRSRPSAAMAFRRSPGSVAADPIPAATTRNARRSSGPSCRVTAGTSSGPCERSNCSTRSRAGGCVVLPLPASVEPRRSRRCSGAWPSSGCGVNIV